MSTLSLNLVCSDFYEQCTMFFSLAYMVLIFDSWMWFLFFLSFGKTITLFISSANIFFPSIFWYGILCDGGQDRQLQNHRCRVSHLLSLELPDCCLVVGTTIPVAGDGRAPTRVLVMLFLAIVIYIYILINAVMFFFSRETVVSFYLISFVYIIYCLFAFCVFLYFA